jgi:hypothetical protein
VLAMTPYLEQHGRGLEEFGSKTLQIHFCVFEKNAVKVWNLLGNALEIF